MSVKPTNITQSILRVYQDATLRAAVVSKVLRDDDGQVVLRASKDGEAFEVVLGHDWVPRIEGEEMSVGAQRELLESLFNARLSALDGHAASTLQQALKQNTGENYASFSGSVRTTREDGTLITSQRGQKVFTRDGKYYFAVTNNPGWGAKLALRPLNSEETRVLLGRLKLTE